jgi:hypothetical protein
VARLASVRQIWTFIFGYGFSLVAVLAGPATASRMIEHHPHAGVGYALLATMLGTLSLVPLIALIFWMYRRSDEYERHGMLVTASIAFAVSLLVMAALDMLSQSDLAGTWVWAPRWWTMVLCWMVSMLIVHVLRRRAA